MQGFWQIVQANQAYALLAFVVAVFVTPIAIRAATRFGVMDIPDQGLKPHARPTPYLGGTAICAAWSAALLAAMIGGAVEWRLLLPVLIGGVILSIMGLIDDARHITPKLRLLIGAVVVTAVMLLTGAGLRLVESFSPLYSKLGIEIPVLIAAPISLVVGVFIVLGACNSTNLIDGLDGLCSGVTAIISLGFFLLASHLAVWNYSSVGDPARLVLSFAMFGAAMGFLPWNFNPAKVFMGDAGSVLLGYNCGMIILLFAERGILRWVIGALMIFALPIFDTALAMFRRWRSGRSIFEGDRSHFYDQLVQRGLSVRATVLVCYGLTVVYGLIGLLLTWVDRNGPVIRTRYAVPLYLGVCAVTALIAYRTGLMRAEERK
jgi:UDP-GlcNAc:undecaprenyl-phosphate GlcNAc-1-phosphate transferase